MRAADKTEPLAKKARASPAVELKVSTLDQSQFKNVDFSVTVLLLDASGKLHSSGEPITLAQPVLCFQDTGEACTLPGLLVIDQNSWNPVMQHGRSVSAPRIPPRPPCHSRGNAPQRVTSPALSPSPRYLYPMCA
jgi:hypothetical protein